MGLFSTDATVPQSPKPSADGAFQAPNRHERAHCWEARDAFFKCLDHNGIIDSIKDHSLAGDTCGKEGQAFERDCASSWVSDSRWRKYVDLKRYPADPEAGPVL